jgi:uncharacterized Zn finger protein
MLICTSCGSAGKRRPRTFLERIVYRAKVKCSNCGDVWYWRRYFFQSYTQCPECGSARLSKLSKYDQIDRRTKNVYRRFLAIFGAPIYHCTFCRLQFRDVRKLDPDRPPKVRISV